MQPAHRIGIAVGRALAVAGALVFVGSLVVGLLTYVDTFGRDATPFGAARALPALTYDAAAFSLFALHHSFFARTGLKRVVERLVTPRFERTAYIWIASLLFLWLMLGWRPVPGVLWYAPRPLAIALALLQSFGVIISVRASAALDVFALAGLRQAFDRPAPAVTDLKADGWYGLVRHPIYLGWVLMVWPAPIMTGTRLAFAAISTAYLVLAIPFEERSLRAQFGAAYARYAARVKWRILPGVY